MPPKRVFVNSVDLYVGQNIAKHFAESVIGAALEEADEEDEEDEGKVKDCYTVIGTLQHEESEKPKWLSELVENTEEGIKAAVLTCDYILWDISSNQNQVEKGYQAINGIYENMEEYTGSKLFVCVSTVFCWGKTRPSDPEDLEAPIREDEYRRRRAHDKYRRHIDLEKHITKCGKQTRGKLKTLVVASGLNYGAGENLFHDMFRSAWHLDPKNLRIFGEGKNVLPTIHILDLASVITFVVESGPEAAYLIAADNSMLTLSEIAKCISENLGTGTVESFPGDLPPLDVSVAPSVDELLSLDLRLEPTTVRDMQDTMTKPWIAPEGFVESVGKIVMEYKVTRGLLPVKVYFHGPPLSGTESIARDLCAQYKLHYVSKATVIAESIAKLEGSKALLEQGDLEGDAKDAAEEDVSTLQELETAKEENGGEYENEQIIAWYKAKLESMACRNQGYVSDSFPETEEQATELFAPPDDVDDDETPPPSIVPEFVVALEASDDLLYERARGLSESKALELGYDEEGTKTAVAAFRTANTVDETVLNFFDYQEIHPLMLDVSNMSEADVIKRLKVVIGKPHNYGPTPAEKQELEKQKAAKKVRDDAKAASDKAKADAEEAQHRKKSQQEWDSKLGEIKHQEAEALDASSLPLRSFLMRHIMPTLSEGLAEVCKARPSDPIDALAEFLFKANPQIE
eukprot:m.265967 g.265967  ORF g.265967 m.265967 type:complete len:687 (+) comp64686_c0_seq1:174-2234(+)